MTLLQTEKLTKHFEALTAVDHVDLRVEAGTIHSLIGPNAAGKTTLFNLISGEARAVGGAGRIQRSGHHCPIHALHAPPGTRALVSALQSVPEVNRL